jgi:DNA-binding transcriptional regulator YdaS (Cro superfamily)
MTPIQKAISILGGASALARFIGVTPQAACNYRDGREVPAEFCPTIERATNGAVRCEDLRPDVDWTYLRGTNKEAA